MTTVAHKMAAGGYATHMAGKWFVRSHSLLTRGRNNACSATGTVEWLPLITFQLVEATTAHLVITSTSMIVGSRLQRHDHCMIPPNLALSDWTEASQFQCPGSTPGTPSQLTDLWDTLSPAYGQRQLWCFARRRIKQGGGTVSCTVQYRALTSF